jgi:hypothetical protein
MLVGAIKLAVSACAKHAAGEIDIERFQLLAAYVGNAMQLNPRTRVLLADLSSLVASEARRVLGNHDKLSREEFISALTLTDDFAALLRQAPLPPRPARGRYGSSPELLR